MRKISITLLALLGFVSASALADSASAQKLADKYEIIAKYIEPDYEGLSPADGKAFFERKLLIEGEEVACASCHTTNPAAEGKNIVTKKPIKPLAPSANPKRFSDLDKVEKNFAKHCLDVLGRDCSAREKANYIAYMLSIK